MPTFYSEVNGFGTMKKLYKYVTADIGKKILENGTMRWSTPAVLNDPFDMQFAFQLPTDMQAVRAKVFERWYQRVVGDRINRATSGIGIAARTTSSWKPTTREEFEQEIGNLIDQTLSLLVNGVKSLNKFFSKNILLIQKSSAFQRFITAF